MSNEKLKQYTLDFVNLFCWLILFIVFAVIFVKSTIGWDGTITTSADHAALYGSLVLIALSFILLSTLVRVGCKVLSELVRRAYNKVSWSKVVHK